MMNWKNFGTESNMKELREFLNEMSEEFVAVDMENSICETSFMFNQLYWYVANLNNGKKLVLEDYADTVCPLFIKMKDIYKIVKGDYFYDGQFLLVLKNRTTLRITEG